MILICNSLIIREIEQLFVYVLTVCISSFVNYLLITHYSFQWPYRSFYAYVSYMANIFSWYYLLLLVFMVCFVCFDWMSFLKFLYSLVCYYLGLLWHAYGCLPHYKITKIIASVFFYYFIFLFCIYYFY